MGPSFGSLSSPVRKERRTVPSLHFERLDISVPAFRDEKTRLAGSVG
jgi:hypothetical protein